MQKINIMKLSNKFYNKYRKYKEILMKKDRPYLILIIKIKGINYAIPFRSNINHKYRYKLSDTGGLDFLKCIPILDNSYLEATTYKIKKGEFNKLNSEYKLVAKNFEKFVYKYIEAVHKPNKRNEYIRLYSTLQYFHNILNI